jgi:hypothetical protein
LSTGADDSWVQRAIARWPGVPACHGWLALDARGRWLLDGKPATHPGLVALLSRHYQRADDGAWFVQNGPQKVFVDILSAPWVALLDGAGTLISHTGAPLPPPEALLIDEQQQLYLVTSAGLAVLCDRDYAAFVADLALASSDDGLDVASGCAAEEAAERALDALLSLRESSALLPLIWRTYPLEGRFVPSAEMETRFGFKRVPRP